MLPSGRVVLKPLLAALVCSVALTLTGCGIGVSAPVSNGSFNDEAVSVYGSVFGGQTPITHATVNLYSSGTASSSYGTGASKLATYYNASDTNGSFSFTKLATAQAPSSGISDGTTSTWACPTSGDPIIYILAIGGDPQSGTDSSVSNPVVVQAAAIGPCSTITSYTHLQMNELSTAAFASAFAQYLSPGTGIGNEQLGTSSTAQGSVGLLNAWNTLSQNLLLVSTGTVYTSTQFSGTGSASGITVTATPESSKLIAIGNILASCVNNNNTTNPATDTNCLELFDAAAKPYLASATSVGGTFPAADDTLMAALYMQINPAGINASGVNTISPTGQCHITDPTQATNPKCLFNLISKNAPFVDGLTPITAAPSDWNIGITYTASGTCSNGASFFAAPYASAIDANGNIFWVNAPSATGASILGEMSPVGFPLACLGTSLTANGRGVAIDPTGNVWAAFNNTKANGVEELPVGGSSLVAWATPDYPYGLTIDGSGNIFFSGAASGGTEYKFAAPGTSTTPVAASTYIPQIYSSSSATYFFYQAPDPSGDIWLNSVATSNIFDFNQVAGSTVYTTTNTTVSSGGTATMYLATNAALPEIGSTVTLCSCFTNTTHKVYLNGITTTVTANSSTNSTFTITIPTSPTSTLGKSADVGTATTVAAVVDSSNAGASGASYGLATDNTYIYSGIGCCASTTNDLFQKITPGTNATITTTSSPQFIGGINGVRAIAMDGAANVWLSSEFASIGTYTATGNWGLAEVATAGSGSSATFTALSPGAGGTAPGTCTTSAGCATGGGFIKSSLIEARSLSIDPSGNVWNLNTAVLTNGTSATETFTGNSITELVGIAVPVVTPISVGAKNSKLASRP